MQGLTWLWVLEERGVSEVPQESETGQGETEQLCEGAHSGNCCLLGGRGHGTKEDYHARKGIRSRLGSGRRESFRSCESRGRTAPGPPCPIGSRVAKMKYRF